MGTRKDIIINKAKKGAQRWKITDIDTMFTRPYDFKDNMAIFDYRNEYSYNYRFAQMYNFQKSETWLTQDTLRKTNKDKDPMYRLLQKDDRKQVTCQQDNKYKHVELINMGYDNGSNNCKPVQENLYCNEELPPSDELEIIFPDDPYAASDDSRDKDFIPEEDLQSKQSDETVMVEDETLNGNKDFQHCEFEDCKDIPISCCIDCQCLLCSVHFSSVMKFDNCKKHKAYSTGNRCNYFQSSENHDDESKENELNALNLLPERERREQTQQYDDNHNNCCEFENCDKEIFSTCGKCLCFLCFTHFDKEDTYNDCKKHISSSIQKYTERKKQEKLCNKPKPKVHNDLKAKNKISEEQNKGLTKKGNLRKRKKIEETLEERKQKKSKMEMEKLTLKDPCTETCRKKCTEKIDCKRRKELNAKYVSMSWESKGCFIKSVVETKKVACRKSTNTGTPKRDVTYSYYFYVDKTRIEVCKPFFLATLGYNPKNDTRVLLALQRPIDKQQYQKGSYERKKKYDKEVVKQQIMSFNPVNSHYRREHAPQRLYLPSDITITLMHKQFCDKHPEQIISFDVYRKIVRDEMNISFAHLGNEECEVCAHFELHKKTHDHELQNEDCDICKKYYIHKKRYRESRKAYQNDAEKSKEETTDTIYYSVDLQKVVMLPRMEQFKRAIFCPRIIAFNESFVPLGRAKNDNIPFAAVWNEVTSGRKQEDIISTLNAFLLKKRDVKNIVLWMDNCTAQNKNWALLSYLVYIINSTDINANTITLKYFEPGHTFMSADSFHHQVEQALQRKNKVYDFSDFVDAVQQANSQKTFVKTMEVADFKIFIDLSSQHKVRKIEPRVYLKDIMVLEAKRGEFTLRYKINQTDTHMLVLDFLQKKYLKSKSFPIFIQKTSPRGIPASTKNGIISKLIDLMPENRRNFWLNLYISDDVAELE